jgi:hypothetical protein
MKPFLLGLLDVSRPSASDNHAWIPAEQKRRRHPRANPRVHLRFLAPRRAPQLGPRWRRRGPSHRRTRPPMGGRAAVEQLLDRAVPAHRVDLGGVARQSMSDAEEDGTAAGPLADPRARRWVDTLPSSGSSAGPYPRRHGWSRARSRERRLEIYPRGEWIHPQSVVAATRSFTKGESRNLLLLHLKNLRSSPSNFYPDLDPRT